MKKNKKNKKYNLGGLLKSPLANMLGNQAYGIAAGQSLDSVGNLFNTIGKDSFSPYGNLGEDMNPYMKKGGYIENNSKPIIGNSHENGGVQMDTEGNVNNINPELEAEGGEKSIMLPNGKKYILPKSGYEIKVSDKLDKKFKNANLDFLEKNALQHENDRLAKSNEFKKQLLNLDNELDKYQHGGDPEKRRNRKTYLENNKEYSTDQILQSKDYEDEVLSRIYPDGKVTRDNTNVSLQNMPNTLIDNRDIVDIDKDKTGDLFKRVMELAKNPNNLSKNIEDRRNTGFTPQYADGGYSDPFDINSLNKTQPLPKLPMKIGSSFPDNTSITSSDNQAYSSPSNNFNYGNLADSINTGVVGYDLFRSFTNKPNKVNPRLTDYSKSDALLYNQSVDNTQAKQDAIGQANASRNLIRNSNRSLQTSNALQANVYGNLGDQLGRLSSQQRMEKNRLNSQLGAYEASKAQENAAKLRGADQEFAQRQDNVYTNKSNALQNLNEFGNSFRDKQFAQDALSNRLDIAKVRTKEGFALLEQMVTDFGLSGSKEWEDYLSDPTNQEKLAKVTSSMSIKYKQ